MKVRIITLGCKVNQYESQAMLSDLLEHGYEAASDSQEADVVIVNSCTVTASSDQKVRQTVRRARSENPRAAIVLTGCMPQAFPEQSAKLSEADIVIGNRERGARRAYLERYEATRERIVEIAPHETGEPFEPMCVSEYHERTRAFLKIEDGCNRFCSYCIIPYARGRVRSKRPEDLRAELETLAKNGYREVVLTGINLSCYGEEFGLDLCDAVEAACAASGIERVRLGSLEPERLSKEVIARLAKQEKLCDQFHLSLQSGCDRTLSRMNRHYTCAQFSQIAGDLREAFPNAALTTDVMVGFSGETREEFEESLRFVEKIGFAKVHVFPYSRRPGTRAYDFPEIVDNREKGRRSREMIAAADAVRKKFLETQLGRTEPVLFEQRGEDGCFEGYTKNYTPVKVRSDCDLHGRILRVKLVSLLGDACFGELSEDISEG